MGSVRNHINFELVSSQGRLQRVSTNLRTVAVSINEDLVGVSKVKAKLIDKPVYLGITILGLKKTCIVSRTVCSKSSVKHTSSYVDIYLFIYLFYYLTYGDADSDAIQADTEDIYEDFKDVKEKWTSVVMIVPSKL